MRPPREHAGQSSQGSWGWGKRGTPHTRQNSASLYREGLLRGRFVVRVRIAVEKAEVRRQVSC